MDEKFWSHFVDTLLRKDANKEKEVEQVAFLSKSYFSFTRSGTRCHKPVKALLK